MIRNLASQPLYEHFHRRPREPLKTLAEMAEEFGVTHGELRALIQHRGGPAPELSGKSNQSSKKNYYKPSEMRKWWASVGSGHLQESDDARIGQPERKDCRIHG